MKQIDLEMILRFYEYFYKKRFRSPKYKYKPSDKALKCINTFLSLLDKKIGLSLIGEEFLWGYFVYQFNYWRDAELQAMYGKFRIELVVGKKALQRFIDNEYNNMWVIGKSEILNQYGFESSDLLTPKPAIPFTGRGEIQTKQRYYGTNKGFYICIETTTLYNHLHKCCLFCKFKDDCKQVLKDNYPNIYEKRGY